MNDVICSEDSPEPLSAEQLLALNLQLQEEIALLRSELSIARMAADFYFNEANQQASRR